MLRCPSGLAFTFHSCSAVLRTKTRGQILRRDPRQPLEFLTVRSARWSALLNRRCFSLTSDRTNCSNVRRVKSVFIGSVTKVFVCRWRCQFRPIKTHRGNVNAARSENKYSPSSGEKRRFAHLSDILLGNDQWSLFSLFAPWGSPSPTFFSVLYTRSLCDRSSFFTGVETTDHLPVLLVVLSADLSTNLHSYILFVSTRKMFPNICRMALGSWWKINLVTSWVMRSLITTRSILATIRSATTYKSTSSFSGFTRPPL